MNSLEDLFPDNMRPPVAAKYSGVSESKLAKLRMSANRQHGPRFVKVAGCIIYRRKDLDAWLSEHLVDAADLRADCADGDELKAHILAAYNRMPRADQSAFLEYAQGKVAA